MTIYALSSGPGVSGVAVIRISGPETAKVLKKLTNKEIPMIDPKKEGKSLKDKFMRLMQTKVF